MIRVSSEILQRVTDTYGRFVERLSGIPAAKCASDVLNEEKVHDQIALLCRLCDLPPQELRGKRILDVGSGFGVFVAVARRDYGLESFGVEPASPGFDSSYQISREILADCYGLPPNLILNACGENLPFQAGSFDLVFSSTVLEHTQDPEQVLREAVRVTRTDGHVQFVYPNYGSCFEGHYALPWIPHLPHFLGRVWVRCWGRDPSFVDTLVFTNYSRSRRWARRLEGVEVIGYGENIFRERMRNLALKDWGGLGRLKPWLDWLARWRLLSFVAWLLAKCHAFDPIILTLRRVPRALPATPDNQAIYDLNWPDWVDMKKFGPSSRWQRTLIHDRLHAIEKGAVRSVLDYGCGEGTTTMALAEWLPSAGITGVDRSGAGINCARLNYQRTNLQFHHDPLDATAQARRYDLVTCFEVLEHVSDWAALADQLCAMTDRYLLVSFPTGRMRKFEINIGHYRNFPRGAFESHLRSRGFRMVNCAYAGFPFYSPLFREMCNLANSGGHYLTVGKYSWHQRLLSNLVYFSFRYLSTRRSGGDQFCGLFERTPASKME